MSKRNENVPTAADRASRALIAAGDKAGGLLGFKLANAASIALFNRDWKPCDPTCEHNQPGR
ncbi:hypothetical protein [Streptomyces sp. NPDC086989]|uniref:hypothetical protein n=1 Tax=Streptomyces sp. NPDC086989 TaxID=3365764 RepID=UPI00380C8AC4